MKWKQQQYAQYSNIINIILSHFYIPSSLRIFAKQ